MIILDPRIIFELGCAVLISINFQRLKRINLSILLPMVVFLLLIDGASKTNIIPFHLYGTHLLEIACIFVGITFYRKMMNTGTLVLLTITFLHLIRDLAGLQLAHKGIYNLFLINFYFIAAAPLWYYYFYKQLRPRGFLLVVYLIIAGTSFLFYSIEYFSGNDMNLNNFTIVAISTQQIIFSFLVVGKLVMRTEDLRPLTDEPTFWISNGMIVLAIGYIPVYGLANFLVREYPEIYTISSFMSLALPVACYFQYSCFLYAFILVGKNRKPGLRDRNMLGPITFETVQRRSEL